MGLNFNETIAMVKDSDPSQFNAIMDALRQRHGTDSIQDFLKRMQSQDPLSENPFMAGVQTAMDIPKAASLKPLWYGLYPRRVTLLIGETGVGKSSLLYNIAIHAALGQPLYDYEFSRLQKVFYLDPENAGNFRDGEMDGGLTATKLDRIGKGRSPNLLFHDGRDVDLSKDRVIVYLRDFIFKHSIDLLILDPIANLFNTQQENDNAEAARHGKALTELSRATGACILAAHHTGKDATGNYGRGASARLGAADVGMVFRAKSRGDVDDDTFTGQTRERRDVVRLQIAKDRPNTFGQSSKYLRMAGHDRFELDTFDSWKSQSRDGKTDRATFAEGEIEVLLLDGKARSRQDIQFTLSQEQIGEKNIDIALNSLAAKGVLAVETRERGAKWFQLAREVGDL